MKPLQIFFSVSLSDVSRPSAKYIFSFWFLFASFRSFRFAVVMWSGRLSIMSSFMPASMHFWIRYFWNSSGIWFLSRNEPELRYFRVWQLLVIFASNWYLRRLKSGSGRSGFLLKLQKMQRAHEQRPDSVIIVCSVLSVGIGITVGFYAVNRNINCGVFCFWFSIPCGIHTSWYISGLSCLEIISQKSQNVCFKGYVCLDHTC